MSLHDTQHLTADELDGMLDGTAAERAVTHAASCTLCAAMVALDRRVVTALGTLPMLEPSAAFESRVMADVVVRGPVVVGGVVVSAREREARRRVAIGAAVLGSTLVGGFAWAAANPGAALSFASPAVSEVGQTLWTSLQAVVANTTEQPWFGAARDLVATPARLLPVAAAAAGVYAAALLGFRRLLAEPATDAGW